MSTSVAAKEAFDLLNAGTRVEYRGWGDTRTAARDRAAQLAGISPSQAERLWKHWHTMKTVNGDVYRGLRNAYSHLCEHVENAADAMERRRLERTGNAVVQSPAPTGAGNTPRRRAGDQKEER